METINSSLSNMVLETECDIHELLPQKEPFVMVGRLVSFDMRRTVTETTVSRDNIFVDGKTFTPSGLIENIAQTCAARIGYANKYIFKKNIQLGFIGAIKNLTIHQLPSVGDTIVTTVDIIEEVFGMTLATATIYGGETLMVEAEMKIAVRND